MQYIKKERFTFNLIRLKNRVHSVNSWNIKEISVGVYITDLICAQVSLDKKPSLKKLAVGGFSSVF